MLYYALVFLVVALIAGVLGVSGVASIATNIAYVLFVIAIVLFLVHLLTGRRTLTPYLGIGNFQVSVVSRLNLDRTTTSETIYDPNSRVERSIRTIKQNDLSQNKSTDAPASVVEKLPDQAAVGGAGKQSNETNERKEELTNYEISETNSTEMTDPGAIKRLSVAVLVDGTYATDASGNSAYTPRDQATLDQLQALVRSAIGFSETRGDQVTIANLQFADGPTPPARGAPAARQQEHRPDCPLWRRAAGSETRCRPASASSAVRAAGCDTATARSGRWR